MTAQEYRQQVVGTKANSIANTTPRTIENVRIEGGEIVLRFTGGIEEKAKDCFTFHEK